MKFAKILSETIPLLINPAVLSAHLRLGERNPHGVRLDDPLRPEAKLAATAAAPKGMDIFEYFFGARPQPRVESGVGIIPIRGPIGMGLTEFEKDLGCTDVNDLAQWFDQMQADPKVKRLLLDVDSPGGTILGIPEFAQMVAASKKPVAAFTATEMCSAAYWIASQADEVFATPSSYVGSIGVYIAFEDYSVMYSNYGVKVEVIKSGDLKGAGIAGTSLTDGQRAQLQDRVVELHNEFKGVVTSTRTTVQDDSMRGQSFTGNEGAARGLVTGLVSSRAEMLRRMGT